jgi:hypothetical protein
MCPECFVTKATGVETTSTENHSSAPTDRSLVVTNRNAIRKMYYFARFRASAAVYFRPSLFWDVKRCRFVVGY